MAAIQKRMANGKTAYRTQLIRHLRWWKQHLGCKEVADVMSSILADHRDKLTRKASGATVNRYLAVLSHAFIVVSGNGGGSMRTHVTSSEGVQSHGSRVLSEASKKFLDFPETSAFRLREAEPWGSNV